MFNSELDVLRIDALSEKNFAVISVKQKNRKIKSFVSAYFKFNIPTTECIIKLNNILAAIKTDTIIGVDTNAHSNLWYSQGTNNTARAKGTKVEEMINEGLLIVHNQPNQPNTYSRTDMGTSNIDVTMSTQDLADNVRNWRVHKNITDSDHRLISFTVLMNQDVTKSDTA